MTSRGQRIGIWVIAVVMAVGSLGVFFVAILANQNNSRSQADAQKILAEYNTAVTDEGKKYYPVLSSFTGQVVPFDAASVTELSTTDLKEGDGATIAADTSYSAYYIGFNPSGTIFDQSITGETLKAPLTLVKNTGVIEGFSKGVVGMKLGGVREITIPATQAYGSQSPSADIPANTPLKFIVLAFATPEAITKYNAASAAANVTQQ